MTRSPCRARTSAPPCEQAYFREHRPRAINDRAKNKIVPADNGYTRKRALPDIEFPLLGAGHFLFGDKADVAAPRYTTSPTASANAEAGTRSPAFSRRPPLLH